MKNILYIHFLISLILFSAAFAIAKTNWEIFFGFNSVMSIVLIVGTKIREDINGNK